MQANSMLAGEDLGTGRRQASRVPNGRLSCIPKRDHGEIAAGSREEEVSWE
jgi:hypothetical protein